MVSRKTLEILLAGTRAYPKENITGYYGNARTERSGTAVYCRGDDSVALSRVGQHRKTDCRTIATDSGDALAVARRSAEENRSAG
jgi:hypothetical protein